MSVSLTILLVATIVLVVLSAALSQDRFRQRLIGGSGLRAALVPLVTAAVLWISALSTGLLKSRIEETTAPEDALAIFVEKISFGIPTISTEFFDRDYSQAEKKRELAALRVSDDPIQLSQSEIDRLNEISRKSGQLEGIDGSRALTTKIIANVLVDPLNFGYRYGTWSSVSNSWADYLAPSSQGQSRQQILETFVGKIRDFQTAAGLFQGIVGMRARQTLTIPDVTGDCSTKPIRIANLELIESKYYLTFPTFRSMIGKSGDREDARRAIKELAALFENGCNESLAAVFRSAAQIYDTDKKLMRQYVEEWNRILASKEAESITIRVAIANVGRFNSFIRRQSKVAVGVKGSSDKIEFILEAKDIPRNKKDDEDESEAASSEYIQIASRSTDTSIFYARLPKENQKKLYGAFQSEQTFLRMGFLASAGAAEGEVFTQIVPFSIKAQLASKEKVQSMRIAF